MHKSFILHHKTDNKERFYTCNLLIHRFLMCIVQTLPGFVQISFFSLQLFITGVKHHPLMV